MKKSNDHGFQFVTKYTYQDGDYPLEKNSGECLVDNTGYIDNNRFIQQCLTAGDRLDTIRGLRYDSDYYGDEVDLEDVYDVTRDRNFDDIDLANYKRYIQNKLKEASPDGVLKDNHDSDGDSRSSVAVADVQSGEPKADAHQPHQANG